MRRATLALLLPLFLVLTLTTTPLVYADDIDISDFDAQLGEALGVGETAGGMIASMLVIAVGFVLLTVGRRRRPEPWEGILLGVGLMGTCVVLGWFPSWFMVVIVLLIALLFGREMIGIFGGRLTR